MIDRERIQEDSTLSTPAETAREAVELTLYTVAKHLRRQADQYEKNRNAISAMTLRQAAKELEG